MSTDPLLQPLQLKHLTLRNRLMSTAHEPAYTQEGLPKDRYRLYHAEKAKGGIALTMIGGSSVVDIDSPQAFGNIQLHRDDCVKWLRELADDVHEHGAAVMIQMTHLGARTNWNKADWLPMIAPSSIPEPAHRSFPKAMEDWDIERLVKSFADAAERVRDAGLDGLELECASHIIAQSWSKGTNKREDEYGGSLDNRMRLVRDILSAIRDRIGREFVVGVRMVCDEQWEKGLSADEGVEIARRLNADGMIDFINVIRGRAATDEGLSRVIPTMGSPSAPHLDFAGYVRSQINLPTFHAARIQDVATARHAIASGKLDMVAMTRAHMADPHIANKLIEGREHQIRPCVGMGYCIDSIYSGQAVCIHNAATGREETLSHTVGRSSNGRKKVVVVGAGPGGLEAARVAAERGHEVVVFEAGSKAGGQVVLTAALKRRREIMGIIDWRLEECARLGVQIKYDHYAGVDDVLAEQPDYVVTATGGIPNLELLSGGEDLATTSWDVLSGAVTPTGSVLICDSNGSHQGMTIAEFIAATGVDLELVTPERTLAPDIGATNYPVYLRALNAANARITLNLRLERLERRGNKIAAIFEDEYAKRRIEKEADHVVVEYGTTPLDELYFGLKDHSINRGEVDHKSLVAAMPQTVSRNPEGRFQLYRIGDAVASRNIHAAVLEGYRLMALV
ncbi:MULTISPECIES: NADH:flavin oxidoreductase [unclassified Mesorhizobium]|uniref:NADH:flavin oxidoreductase n=1 Tax=unclassified Mesorhizobium TaxID=325217 RepID=UPI000BB03DF0|nr:MULTISPECIES: NADH:flavin oxidoreductase [unclassified Mesorhizobium]TGT60804.1 N-methylproline demethylase [Mesorhizobium sp. M00.F.Ca.ET.170.01.1.1]AZO10096.1 N-methylproline demethylase [Mesorhizobium sp. M3A.F.Ca.ET.080.04.2.1]PBB86553.1 N-methylproline demethylase [Mesorhizobium sp. WSM3876]RWB75783.1 MAG: N-methylproline demethylase [Mesorhizobium sp.]RWE23586.1 MAG: N-methylproline demethylase [Mesorhizobium sp.]